MSELLALSQAHMAQQVRDAAVIQTALSVAFDRAVDPADLSRSYESFLKYATSLIAAGRTQGIVRTDAFYRASRMLSELGAVVPDVPPPVIDLAATRTSLVVTGPVNAKQRIAKGQDAATATRLAKAAVLGAAKRHVLNGGRERMLSLVENDEKALGWARQPTSGKLCHFCAMLVSRGPVYRSRSTSSFRAHDRCGCVPRPVFRTADGWTDQARELRDLWDSSGGRLSDFRSALNAPAADTAAIAA